MAVDGALRAELAVRGVRGRPSVRRRGGAGPSDDGHVLLQGSQTTLPLADDSPFAVGEAGGLLRDGEPIGGVELELVGRPRFYDLTTAEGIPYEQIAKLHGAQVLATTAVQTCVRYDPSQRCRFCTIEESLRSGDTIQVKRPEQIAEVAQAAVRLDGIRQLVMTTGTANHADRGARHLARCCAAVARAVPGLPIQVQCEPPGDLGTITELREAGATAIGIHVESLDDGVRRRWMPGKATVPLRAYWRAWREAVAVFGHNRVSTYLLVGLGEDPDELVAGARELIYAGVYPFVVPFRPLAGSLALADGARAPAPELLASVTRRVADALVEADMSGDEQGAGCAACGACSALSAAGG